MNLISKYSIYFAVLLSNIVLALLFIFSKNLDVINIIGYLFIYVIIVILTSRYLELLNHKYLKKGLKSSVNDLINNKNIESDYYPVKDLYNFLNSEITTLSQNNAKYLHVVNNLRQGVLLIDGSDKVVLANDYFKTEFKIKNTVNKYITDLKINDLIIKNYEQFNLNNLDYFKFLIEGEKVFELRYKKIAGSWIDNVLEEGTLIIINEVTDIFKTSKIKQEFLANASHELKTPITKIRAYSELLLEENDNLPLLDKILDTSIEMTSLINNILDLSKLETNDYVLRQTKLDMNLVIDKYLVQYKELAETKNLRIYKNIKVDNISTDEVLMNLVLRNLINNAIKYNKDNGEIYINVENDFIEIKDTGIGISSIDKDRVFERFYRVNSSVEGTGLGLSIVKHALQTLDYKIEISSVLDEGTSIKIYFK